jgi:hypothetical protein
MSKNYENHLETFGVVQKRRMMTPLARNPVTPTCQQQWYLLFIVPAVPHNLFLWKSYSNTAFGKSFGRETKAEMILSGRRYTAWINSGFRIRIDLMRIRILIRIQHFF